MCQVLFLWRPSWSTWSTLKVLEPTKRSLSRSWRDKKVVFLEVDCTCLGGPKNESTLTTCRSPAPQRSKVNVIMKEKRQIPIKKLFILALQDSSNWLLLSRIEIWYSLAQRWSWPYFRRRARGGNKLTTDFSTSSVLTKNDSTLNSDVVLLKYLRWFLVPWEFQPQW